MNPKRFLAAALLICALAASTTSARAQTLPIAPLGWLVGGTWVAQGTNLPPGTARIETQYHWAATGNFIQFTTQFVGQDGKPNGNYAGNFYFDPGSKHATMWYMDRENAITQGTMEFAGDRWSMFFTESGNAAGTAPPVDYRVDVTKVSTDAYHWALSARKSGSDGAYKPLFGLDYTRQAG